MNGKPQIFGMPQQAQMVLSTPFNDAQLIALIASQMPGETAGEKAAAAAELVVEAIMQVPRLPGLVRQRQQAQAESN